MAIFLYRIFTTAIFAHVYMAYCKKTYRGQLFQYPVLNYFTCFMRSFYVD